jgi:hypothetical protein
VIAQPVQYVKVVQLVQFGMFVAQETHAPPLSNADGTQVWQTAEESSGLTVQVLQFDNLALQRIG